MKLFRIIVLLFLPLYFYQCANHSTSINEIYQNAIHDAMCPDSTEISYDLTEINNRNDQLIWKIVNNEKYLLVVTWTNSDYSKIIDLDSGIYNTGSEDIWITVVPELQKRIRYKKIKNLDIRLKQLIGLPPFSEYNFFVEFWVKPSDLFRPCPDAEINDNHCELCFPNNADSLHIEWINDTRISSYYNCELYDNYPWTQLGYTYDWNPENKSHFGLSEFVIKQNSTIFINAIYTTQEYFK